MNRYNLNINKTILQLIPFYINGRVFQLYVKALLSPLQEISDKYSEWAFEKKILANLTSQKIKLEWYLNWKFGKYFANPKSKIVLSDKNQSQYLAPTLYRDPELNIALSREADNSAPYFMWGEFDYPNLDFRSMCSDGENNADYSNDNLFVFRESDDEAPLFIDRDIDFRYSFFIFVPKLDLLDELTLVDFDNSICSIVDDYKLATKTYKIIYEI